MDNPQLDPRVLVQAYRQGYFPMADEHGEVQFYAADPRAVFPLKSIAPSKRTRKLLAEPGWHSTRDTCFADVISACAAREETWINGDILEAFKRLHGLGIAHSVEVWNEEELVGGLYGVAIGGVFCGESMFSTESNASKMAFYSLVAHLNAQGFQMLDSQFINPFTKQLGAIEVPADDYLLALAECIDLDVSF